MSSTSKVAASGWDAETFSAALSAEPGSSERSLLVGDLVKNIFPAFRGIAHGKEQIGQMFGDVGATLKRIAHDYSHFNWVFSGSDVVVCEGTSHGEHKDGPWRADVPEWAAGRWCDVFEIRDFKINRCFIYLDPDYAGKDTARYPWLKEKAK